MIIQSISCDGNISKGRQEFDKLSDTQKAVKLAIENFRQNYNSQSFPPLVADESNLGIYVRHSNFINNFIKQNNRVKQIFAQARRSVGL